MKAGFLKEYQFTEPIDDEENRIFFEYPSMQSTLVLPDDVERETIAQTVNKNGEMLNYDKANPCNRLVIINKNKDLYLGAVFVKVMGNEEKSEKVQRAKELSKRLGIPFIEIDKALCRERLGLTPLTEKEEKSLKDSQSL